MKFTKKLKLAFGMLKNAKLRSWLTIIGIVIAVASVTTILSFGEGIKNEVNSQVGDSGVNTITLYKGWSEQEGLSQITILDYEELKKIPEIEYISRYVYLSINFSFYQSNSKIRVTGTDIENFKSLHPDYKITQGRSFREGDQNVLLIPEDYVNNTFDEQIKVGDLLTTQTDTFKIIGIYKVEGFFGDSSSFIMPFSKARDIISQDKDSYYNEEDYELPAGVEIQDKYDFIKFKIDEKVDYNLAKQEIENRLIDFRKTSRDDKNFSFQGQENVMEIFNNIINIVTWVLVGFASISILVGSVGIANTMFTSVLEKTKEIGIMKAIGANSSDIKMIFLLNSGLLGLAGGVIGVLIGLSFAFLGGYLVIHFANIQGVNLLNLISFKIIAGSLLFSIFIGMISGYFPAKNASKMNPVDALRFQ